MAKEEWRKVGESEERLAQERTRRDAQGIQDTGRQPHFRDIEAFLPTKHESDDIFTFVMMFERFLELNGVERGVMGTVITRAIESKGTANIYEVVTRTVAL